MAEEKFVVTGWDGVTVEIPSKWSVVGFYSERKGGYLRVDSPIESVLEMKWSPSGKKHGDLTKIVHDFIDKIKKPLVKKNKRLNFERDVKPERDGAVDFAWNMGDKHGRGRIRVCPDCGRVVLLHLYFSRSEVKSQTINHIFDSVRDHTEDGLVRYSLYGLDFRLPPGYRYKKPVLMSAYISLVFTKGMETVVVEARNLAASLLKQHSLEEWYRVDVAPDLKAYRLRYQPCSVGEWEALSVEGRPSGLLGLLMRTLAFWRTPRYVRGLVWHDRDRNTVFTIRCMQNKETALLDTVRDSMTEAALE
ncbi:MAG: hypothetical protein IK083_08235 [Abditibacteriota bacterium]|nr:hypothetical protein [Abditibacteriota bacterium]